MKKIKNWIDNWKLVAKSIFNFQKIWKLMWDWMDVFIHGCTLLKVKVNMIRMYKIDFYFFLSAIAKESLLYQNKWYSVEKLPKRKRIFVVYYQKILQIKWFAFKLFSKRCQWNVESICRRVILLTTVTSILFITIGL